MENGIVVAEKPSVKAIVSNGHIMAQALKDVIASKKKPVIINGEQYLEFEDWQLLGRFHKIYSQVEWTKEIREKDLIIGYEARAIVVNEEGKVVSAAESMCLKTEKQWGGKDLFAVRSMAQTRACAKALRNVLSWVVVLAGYKSSVAEEMQNG